MAELAQPELLRTLEQDTASVRVLTHVQQTSKFSPHANVTSSTRESIVPEGIDRNVESLSTLRKRTRSQLDELGAVEREELLKTQEILELKASRPNSPSVSTSS